MNSNFQKREEFFFKLFEIEPDVAVPCEGLDCIQCGLDGKQNSIVPILKIYGWTPSGQRGCLIVHNCYPYFYISLPRQIIDLFGVTNNTLIRQLADNINCLMSVRLKNEEHQTSYIHTISIVKKYSFYGFTSNSELFCKIFLYKHTWIKELIDIIHKTPILNTKFRVFESHISYQVQFLTDYNLHGMEYIRCSNVKFRSPLPESKNFYFKRQSYFLSKDSPTDFRIYDESNVTPTSPLAKDCISELQMDIDVSDILNVQEKLDPDVLLVPSLKCLSETEILTESGKLIEKNFCSPFEDANRTVSLFNHVSEDLQEKLEKLLSNNKKILNSKIGLTTENAHNNGLGERITLMLDKDGGRFCCATDLSNLDSSKTSQTPESKDALESTLSTSVTTETSSSMDKILPETKICNVEEIQDLTEMILDGAGDDENCNSDDSSSSDSKETQEILNSQKIFYQLTQSAQSTLEFNSKFREMNESVSNDAEKGQNFDISPACSKSNFKKEQSLGDEEFLFSQFICSIPQLFDMSMGARKEKKFSKYLDSKLNKNLPVDSKSQTALSGIRGEVQSTRVSFGLQEHQCTQSSAAELEAGVDFQIHDSHESTNKLHHDSSNEEAVSKRHLSKFSQLKRHDGKECYIPSKCGLSGECAKVPMLDLEDAFLVNDDAKRQSAFRNPDSFKYKDASYHSFKRVDDELRVMSIEVYAGSNSTLLPDPIRDPIYCIFCCVQSGGNLAASGEKCKVFELDCDCTEPDLSTVAAFSQRGALNLSRGFGGCTKYKNYKFSSEFSMLGAFEKYLIEVDPDVLLGHDCVQGSIGYVMERAERISMPFVSGRTPMRIPGGSMSNGRVVLSVGFAVAKHCKLADCSLENALWNLFKLKIARFEQQSLNQLYIECKSDLKDYFLVRTVYNLRIIDKLELLRRTAEDSKTFGVSFSSALNRGSQYLIESLLIRINKALNYLCFSPDRIELKLQRKLCISPLVLQPIEGLYRDPVLVFDFQSLYPSVIIAYNYCYSTCLGSVDSILKCQEELLKKISGNAGIDSRFSYKIPFGVSSLEVSMAELDFFSKKLQISPNGTLFVSKEQLDGVVPRMLYEIIKARVSIKNSMKRTNRNDTKYSELNFRQAGLKMLSNTISGYIGARISGNMPCVDIFEAILSTARWILETAIDLIKDDSACNAEVIYGDTDSIFVSLTNCDRQMALKIGEKMAKKVTAANRWPIKLIFQGIYQPSIFVAKKRYSGYKYDPVNLDEKTLDIKGMESVRRSTCPLVARVMKRCLEALFEDEDVEKIRLYLQREILDFLEERVPLGEIIFTQRAPGLKKYRSMTPSAVVASKAMSLDPRVNFKRGQRVPYVVVSGSLNSRFRDLVCHPKVFMESLDCYRINTHYYIYCSLFPALKRIFDVASIDISQWFFCMQIERKLMKNVNKKKIRIDDYFGQASCSICGEDCTSRICQQCQEHPAVSHLITQYRFNQAEKNHYDISSVCLRCTAKSDFSLANKCSLVSCAFYYFRVKSALELSFRRSQLLRFD